MDVVVVEDMEDATKGLAHYAMHNTGRPLDQALLHQEDNMAAYKDKPHKEGSSSFHTSFITIGTCATHSVLTYQHGTQAAPVQLPAGNQATKKHATGITTSNMRRQDTPCA